MNVKKQSCLHYSVKVSVTGKKCNFLKALFWNRVTKYKIIIISKNCKFQCIISCKIFSDPKQKKKRYLSNHDKQEMFHKHWKTYKHAVLAIFQPFNGSIHLIRLLIRRFKMCRKNELPFNAGLCNVFVQLSQLSLPMDGQKHYTVHFFIDH